MSRFANVLRDRRVPLVVAFVGVALAVGAGGSAQLSLNHQAHPSLGLERWIPAMLFGCGLVAAALAAAVAYVLCCGREMAIQLAEQRTHELSETHDFLEGILRASPLVVARRNTRTGAVPYLSPNATRVFGYSASGTREHGFLSDLTHPDDQAQVERALAELIAGSADEQRIETRLQTADGQYRWVSAILVRERGDHDQEDVYVVEYLLDVDDRHRAELAQREAQDAAEAAQARAETASHHKSEFLSHMSHELRTPLNAVLGFAQLLQVQLTDETQQEEVRQILAGGNHLLGLVNDLLDIAKIESGHAAITMGDVDPAQLVSDVVKFIDPLTSERNITVVADVARCRDWVVRADPQRARQVLLNLLSNATKYNKPGGTITVIGRVVSPQRLAIEVTDSGPGIAQDKLDRIFEPFERVGAEYTGVDGAGIGLAVAQKLSDAMHAALTVSSTLGLGSTFAVEFDASPASHPNAMPAPALPAATPATILYVEDDPANLELVRRLLAKDGRFHLIGATTGTLGLSLAAERHPALILLDLKLPDVRGEELLARLRSDPRTASTPVVVLSASALPSHVDRLYAQGAAGYLTKPLVLSELVRVIHDVLGTAEETGAASCIAGPVRSHVWT